MPEIRKLPAVEERVETGPIQFGDDWPGLFIRGDNAMGMYISLRGFERWLDAQAVPASVRLMYRQGVQAIKRVDQEVNVRNAEREEG